MTNPLKSVRNIYGLSTYRYSKPTIRYNKPLDLLGIFRTLEPSKKRPKSLPPIPLSHNTEALVLGDLSPPRASGNTPDVGASRREMQVTLVPTRSRTLVSLDSRNCVRFVDGEEELKWRAPLLVTYFRQYQYFFYIILPKRPQD